MQETKPVKPLLNLAFLTATACSIHIFESLIMRLLPLPFIRLGLSNVVVMYLILNNRPWQAIAVNVTKSFIGGIVTFSLLSPATVLSLGGGLTAIFAMWAGVKMRIGFSTYGVSVLGAVAHNLAQLLLVQWLVLPQTRVFVLTPILLLLALFSGIVTAWILLLFDAKIKRWEHHDNSKQRIDRETA